MSLLWAGLIVLAVAAIAITAMLFVRRTAPEGSYFEDGDRAAGVFGVSRRASRSCSASSSSSLSRATTPPAAAPRPKRSLVAQQFQTAQFLPLAVRRALGRAGLLRPLRRPPGVAADGVGSLGDAINPWGLAMFRTIATTEPQSASEQTAYDKWFDQRSDREAARADRIHGAAGVIPAPLWIVLFLSAGIIFVFMMLFADSGEPAFVQAS